jgi:protein phosphatase
MLVTRFDQIEQASLSDVGVRRSHNQDNLAVLLAGDQDQWQQRGHLFVVADGMGAHAVGEKASEQAAAVIPHTYSKYAAQGPVPALRKAFVEANTHIHSCGQANREFEGMGTTGTALLLRPEGAWIGHVGDSRCYRIRDGIIEQLSYDHSLVWEYARLKRIDPEDVEDIPSNVIHRCLGPEPEVQVDIEGPHPLHGGDIFLLCSDGLSGPVSDPEIGAVASALPPAEACRFLVDLANLRGGPDNITVMIIKLGGSTAEANGIPPPPPPPRKPWVTPPWWLMTLGVGIGLVALAAILQVNKMDGGLPAFVLAALAISAGLVGLLFHYRQEQKKLEEEENAEEPPCRGRAFTAATPAASSRACWRNWPGRCPP